MKNNGDKMKLKSRLVAKGFEEDCLEEIPKYSPTIDKSSLRAVLSVITQHNWFINTIDIKTAFLQSEEFERNVYRDFGIKEIYLWFNRFIIAMVSESKNNYVKTKRTGI